MINRSGDDNAADSAIERIDTRKLRIRLPPLVE
jgi:hypothetical protein